MSRRTFEGPMDWEYQNSRGPVDISSPFSQLPQRSFMGSSFNTDSPSRSNRPANPFAGLGMAGASSRAAPSSPSKQAFPRPPSSACFQPPVAAAGARSAFPAASPFRNPAFTTPQKRVEELFSECSGAEESPANASDASMQPADTPPEAERLDRAFAHATITPASLVKRRLFRENQGAVAAPAPAASSSSSSWSFFTGSRGAPGRGEVPRGKLGHVLGGPRDRVRKRRRQGSDKDVGSMRWRAHDGGGVYASGEEEDGEEEEDDGDVSTSSATTRGERGDRKKGVAGQPPPPRKRGAVAGLFAAIHDHPNVPLILSWWVQLGMNVFFMAVVVWLVWGGIAMMRADIAHAADAARSQLLSQMNDCAHEYTKNRCAPKAERLPALNVVCSEWEVCMNQDPSSVMKMQVSAKNVAEIINEFVGAMSIKAWGFILSAMLAVILASNLGFSRFRETAFVNPAKAHLPSQPAYAGPPAGAPTPSLPPSQDPHQAYIWAPIGQTPRHIRRGFLHQSNSKQQQQQQLQFEPGTPTDTDASPDAPRAMLMSSQQTPSFRRSPSKGERDRSPSKAGGVSLSIFSFPSLVSFCVLLENHDRYSCGKGMYKSRFKHQGCEQGNNYYGRVA
ncbi:nuclear envelope protein [Niveomyces insectorum RCEF 264]|uniref:Nuclear envelope protein n=1 Tax=Niveomyces insectorum RCEF 264 TaxID=1081102 RepID=A0A167WA52_9HYPO|nr:nuclear envelope protein [Niveomyces insectorum RCEF 264]